ncbi:MAG TPA: ATP-binding protein [Solirubrobacterales bacterium]|nr:ATP-binding protein [Solirubrobacterales bacterium]
MSALEHAAGAGWPLALMVAAILVRERLRDGRRRGALNRALHELRRPLQALALAPDAGRRNGHPGGNGAPGKLELALAALDDLDREINGSEPPVRLRPVPCRPWVEGSLGRWRLAAGSSGSPVELRWRAGSATVLADPRRLAQALDNLIVNAIEHGRPPIRVEAAVAAAHVRIVVRDGGCADADPESLVAPRAFARLRALGRRRRSRGRRGHGLDVVARVAAEHGGRFMVRRGPRGTVAALELPLAGLPADAVARASAN